MAPLPVSPADDVVVEDARVAIVRSTGTAEELHRRDPFTIEPIRSALGRGVGLVVRHCVHTDTALVLGSRQSERIVDRDALAGREVGLVQRRSGGGAVLVRSPDMTWIDLLALPGWFPDDVHGSMVAAGRLWLGALIAVGADATADIEVFDGRLMGGPWADLVCFAGRGPGEVLHGDHKLVGLSQRRTRDGVRVSGAVHHRDLVAATADLLAEPLPAGRPAPAATTADIGIEHVAADDLLGALAACSNETER